MSIIRNSLAVGTAAAAATSAAAALFAKAEGKTIPEVLNTTSHIAWGDEAFKKRGFSPKYTVVGVAINAVAIIPWAFLNELLLGKRKARTLPRAVATATAVTAAAYVADYHVVPKRLTPGFEEKVSKEALTGLYVVLAAALVVGSLTRD